MDEDIQICAVNGCEIAANFGLTLRIQLGDIQLVIPVCSIHHDKLRRNNEHPAHSLKAHLRQDLF